MSQPPFDPTPYEATLPDGQSVKMVGDLKLWAGDLGFGNSSFTCVSAALRAFGKATDILSEPLSLADFEDTLRTADLHVVSSVSQSLEDLAQQLELGSIVMILVNAGVFWNKSAAVEDGQENHAVLVTAIARNKNEDIVAVQLRDPSRNMAEFATPELLCNAWLKAGGLLVAVRLHEESSEF